MIAGHWLCMHMVLCHFRSMCIGLSSGVASSSCVVDVGAASRTVRIAYLFILDRVLFPSLRKHHTSFVYI